MWGSYIGKGLVAPFMVANMRFLSRMCSGMHSQRTSLDETLMAVSEVTLVRSLVGMYSVVPAEV